MHHQWSIRIQMKLFQLKSKVHSYVDDNLMVHLNHLYSKYSVNLCFDINYESLKKKNKEKKCFITDTSSTFTIQCTAA